MLRIDFRHTGYGLNKWIEGLIFDLKAELVAQGHYGSGNLWDSISDTVKKTDSGDRVTIKQNIIALDYGLDLNKKQNPKKVLRAAIMRWMDTKTDFSGLTNKKKKSIANAIVKVIGDEGSPTKKSYRFSQNGRRTGWIDVPYRANKISLVRKVSPFAHMDVVDAVNKMLDILAAKNKNIIIQK